MESKLRVNEKMMWMLKSLITSYIISGLLLVLLSLLLYKLDLSKDKIAIGIIIVYVISTFFGGFLMGKLVEVKQYLWGLVLGLLYFALLLFISLGVYGGLEETQIVSTMILCMCGGTMGGMLS